MTNQFPEVIQMKEKTILKKRLRFYSIYTISMLGIFSILLLIFISNGKSFVRVGDGLSQHYTTLAYWGQYLRSVLRTLLLEHRIEFPLWDLKLVFGSDILTTLHYYVIGDPLNLLAVFVPERYTEYLYGFLIFLRFYLAGIAFCAYCFYHRHKEFPVLIGSLIYVYSQWMIVTGLDHPYFLNPCICLPLILLGIDKIFDENKPCIYICSIALSAVSNFYFFYMLGIFAVIYAVFQYFIRYRRVHFQPLFTWLGYFCFYTVTALLISGIILLPMVITFLSNSRMSVERYVPILYSQPFYRSLLAAFAGKNTHTRFSCIGVASICVPALILLFTKFRKYLAMVCGVLMTAIFVCIPFFGHVLNGFSYTSNRWVWVFGMLYAYMFVKIYPEFFSVSKKQRILIGLIGSAYALWLMTDRHLQGPNNLVSGAILLSLTLIFTLGYSFLIRKKQWMAGFFALFLLAGNACNIWFYYVGQPDKNFGIEDFADAGSVYEATHPQAYNQLASLPGIAQVRYDQLRIPAPGNSVLLSGLNGTRFGFSIIADCIDNFFNTMYMNNYMIQSVQNLNSRSWIMKLFSVGYYAGPASTAPYGFQRVEQIPEESRPLYIYKDPGVLPLAYTYDSSVSSASFAEMDAVQRQEAMLQGAVLEESSLPETKPEFRSKNLPFTVTDSQGLSYKDGILTVEKADSRCILNFTGEAECETYLAFTGLQYISKNEKYRTLFETSDSTTAYVSAKPLGVKKSIPQTIQSLSPKNNFTSGRTNYGMNFLYHKKPINQIELTFETPGKYKLSNIEVLCQKTDRLSEFASHRKEEAPSDLLIKGNRITCTADFSKTRELVLSIPYSKGWTLYVDGEKSPIHQANLMFLGAEIPEGKHQIEFVYMTPYLPAGAAATIAGLILLLLTVLLQRKQSKLFLHPSRISGETSV